MSSYQTVTVVNRTANKVTCVWDCSADGNDASSSTFVVLPNEQDIKPHSSAQFRISFRPRQDNYYYAQQLEAFVYVKSNRTFRLVQSDAFVPTWCVRTFVTGHTFAPNAEQFLPSAEFNQTHINFPATRVGERVYQTLMLTNRSDTPLLFDFGTQDGRPQPGSAFRVKPTAGFVAARSFQLVAFEFCPRQSRRGEQALFNCQLNRSASNVIRILADGIGHTPAVELANEGRLFFKPMCQGVVARQQYSFTNTSRVPVQYAWTIPDKFADILRVYPQSGVLRGNETAMATWEFAPNATKSFHIRASLHVTSRVDDHHDHQTDLKKTLTLCPATYPHDPSRKYFGCGDAQVSVPDEEQTLTLHVRGECSTGMLIFEPNEIDFGAIGIAGSGA
jgi:hypothetical protein